MRYLLDTSAVLSHYRQEAGWEEVKRLLDTDGAEILIASVTLTEFGRQMRELGATKQEVMEALANYQLLLSGIVAIDAEVARAAFAIACRTPRRLPLVDALIAAAAQARDALLVHRDEHMRVIPADLLRQVELAAEVGG
jgi:predicted nucleic acid-binding protein